MSGLFDVLAKAKNGLEMEHLTCLQVMIATDLNSLTFDISLPHRFTEDDSRGGYQVPDELISKNASTRNSGPLTDHEHRALVPSRRHDTFPTFQRLTPTVLESEERLES